jgi:hypothetical protein
MKKINLLKGNKINLKKQGFINLKKNLSVSNNYSKQLNGKFNLVK